MLIDLVHYPSPEAVDATAVYVIGDIHGYYELARGMEDLILRDVVAAGHRKPVISFVGDYIDRAPHSADVLAWLTHLDQGALSPIEKRPWLQYRPWPYDRRNAAVAPKPR